MNPDFFESEFYILKLIRTDEEARNLISQYLGMTSFLDRDQMIAEISKQETVWNAAIQLRCGNKQVFAKLRELLDGAQHVAMSPPVVSLTDEDFPWLLGKTGRETIGDLLNCPPDESLQRLFPPKPLKELLINAGIVKPTEVIDDSQWLLYRLLADSARKKLQEFLGFSDRWDVLQYDLLSDAGRIELAYKLKCSEEIALRELIGKIKAGENQLTQRRLHAPFGTGESFDFIGISVLRGHLHRFAYTLSRQAQIEANIAKVRLPGYCIPTLLSPLISFYTLGEYKTALENLLVPEQTLRQIGFKEEITTITKSPEDARLEVVNQTEDPTTEKVDIVIRCHPNSGNPPIDILYLRQVSRNEMEQVRQHLPAAVNDLTQVGSTLSDRVLNMLFPLFSGWKQDLRAAIAEPHNLTSIDNAFVQCFVLSGANLDQKEIIPQLYINSSPNVMNSNMSWVDFPKGPRDIADMLKKQYREKGKNTKQIEF